MNHNNFDRIEKYLIGLMKKEGRSAFEAELRQDKKLAEEFEAQKLERQAMRLLAVEQMREKIGKWMEEEEGEGQQESLAPVVPMYPHRARRVWAVAASIMVLAMAGTGWWADHTYGIEQELHIGLGGSKGEMASGNEIFEDGRLAYYEENYKDAAAFFQGVSPEDPNYCQSRLLAGGAFFHLKKYREAEHCFQEVQDNCQNKKVMAETAEWHFLIAKIAKEGVTGPNKKRLRKILGSPHHEYHTAALELEKKMGSFWWKLVN